MAVFAEINESNIVVRVIVVADEYDSDVAGSAWCADFFGGGTWVRTAEDGSIRANYAGPGHTYDSVNDVFIEPKPYPSWTLDTERYKWQSPVARPDDGSLLSWDEDTLGWVSDI
jgi:hypothetical protein